jgi:tetratricopeptide (TPR) repeat protein
LTEALARLNRMPDALGQLTQAGAALARSGGDDSVALALDHARAVVARVTGDHATEIAQWRHIAQAQQRRHSADSFDTIDALIELVDSYQRAGQVDAAAKTFAQLDRARPASDLPVVAQAAAAVAGNQALIAGDFAKAIAQARLVVALDVRVGASGHGPASNLLDLATVYDLAGEWAAARDNYRAAAERLRALRGAAADSGMLDDALEGVARCEVELGDPAAAIPWARAALADVQSRDDHERNQTATLALARALVEGKQFTEVVDLLTPVVRELEATPRTDAHPPARQAAAAYGLAQALWDGGGDRERQHARSLVADAVRDFGAARDWYARKPVYATARQRMERRLTAALDWQERHR